MRIGILTFFESENYGAVLQAYALQKYLQNQGHTVELIHIKRDVRGRGGHTEKYSFLEKLRIKAVSSIKKQDGERKTNSFDAFRRNYLSVSADYYKSDSDLKDNCPDYDLYISGGDQIWNPYHKVFSLHYMFDFLPEGKKIISYASSFGVNDIQDDLLLKQMKLWLARYSRISVRENSGTGIVGKMGLPAETVCDPVFLISEEWETIADNSYLKKRKPYCLVYALIDYPKTEDTYIVKYASENGLDIVILPYNKRNCLNAYHKEFCASPEDFLNLIKNASAVFTNSFHGAAFSLVFKIPLFILHPASDEGIKKQGRITEMFESMGIDRIPWADCSCAPDYEQMYNKMKEKTLMSKIWLNSAISSAETKET